MLCLRNIRKAFANNTGLMTIYCILQIVSIFAFIFVYTNAIVEKKEYEKYEENASTFGVSFSDKIAYSSLKERVCSSEFGECEIMAYFDQEKTIGVCFEDKSTGEIAVGKKFAAPDEALIDYSVSFSQDKQVGDRIEILEKEYTISGISFSLQNNVKYLLPYESLNDDDTFSYLSFRYNKMPTAKQIENIITKLDDMFSEGISEPPNKRNILEEYGMNSIQACGFFIVIIVLINISFLYQYILLQRRDLMTVFRLCGCKKSRLFIILLGEIVSYHILCMIVAVMVWVASKPLLIGSELYEWTDMLIPLLLCLVGTMAVFIPQIVFYTRNSFSLYIVSDE